MGIKKTTLIGIVGFLIGVGLGIWILIEIVRVGIE